MGVTGAYNIKVDSRGRKLSDLGISIDIGDMKGYRIAVDGNYLLNSSYKAFGNGNDLTTKDGKVTTHIKGIFDKAVMLHKAGAYQLWVFDNPKGNPRKEATRAKRAKTDSRKLTSEQYNEVHHLLELMGIPYIIAPQGIEGEQYAAWLTMSINGAEPICDYVLSSDVDVLFFGGNLIRDYKPPAKKNSNRATKRLYYRFDYQSVLSEIDITRNEFLVIAALLGHDMHPKLGTGIGIARVVDRVKTETYEVSPRAIKQSIEQFEIDPNTWANNNDAPEIIKQEYNRENLITWLVEYASFSKPLLEKKLDDYAEVDW